jgi:diguanylate cyclase (GGDEF)-like protein
LFLAAHGLLPHVLARHAALVSLGFLILAPLLAGAACLGRSLGRGAQGWRMLALSMALWAGGMAANVPAAPAPGSSSGESSLSMLLFVLYGVPIIFIAASPRHEAWSVRLVDAALALALGMLFFVYTFAVPTMAGTNPLGEASLRLMFDIENLFIAGFALLRFSTSHARAERDMFGAVTVFAFLYMVTAGYMNHMQADSDYGGPVDLVIDLPFLALLALAMARPRRADDAYHAPPGRDRFVQAISPLMLPVTLLVVSAALLGAHSAWAVAGFATATLVYGARNVLAHMRNLAERDRLERLAQIDGLTGLPNRRCFDETLQREWSRGRRAGTGMALLMIDIDHFKLLNDTLGHSEGDRRLRDVAVQISRCATRATDLVARYGGEEFVAILPSSDAWHASQLAEIMRASVFNLVLPSPSQARRITVSIGVAHIARINEDDPEHLLAAADAALYEAKRSGRNAVRTSGQAKGLSDLD